MDDTLMLVRSYLAAYAARDLQAIEPMLAEAITLRVLEDPRRRQVSGAGRDPQELRVRPPLAIDVLATYVRDGGAAAELRMVVDERDTLYVVDTFDFDEDGRITAIRAFIGRGD